MANKWVVVKVAPDQIVGEMWVELLREEGVPALIRPSDAISFLGTSGLGCRVMVPEERLEDAEGLLAEQIYVVPDDRPPPEPA